MTQENRQRSIVNADTVAALLFLLFFVAAYATALTFPAGPPGVPGPAFLPKGLAYVGIFLTLLLLGSGVRRQILPVENVPYSRQRWTQVVSVTLLLAVYLLLWGHIHFILLSFGLLMIGGIILRVPLWAGLLTALVLSVGLYLLFARVFYVML